MGIEIERKFLVSGTAWRAAESVHLRQGYLSHDKHRTVRVRLAADAGALTIKGVTAGATRAEFEYAIPVGDARALLDICEGSIVEKRRHVIEFAGLSWEVDEFLGDNAGLVVAEVELESEAQSIARPHWIGEEVTHDPRYFNAALSRKPYATWDR